MPTFISVVFQIIDKLKAERFAYYLFLSVCLQNRTTTFSMQTNKNLLGKTKNYFNSFVVFNGAC